LIIRSDI